MFFKFIVNSFLTLKRKKQKSLGKYQKYSFSSQQHVRVCVQRLDRGIFKWLVLAILKTNLSPILCFISAVTQAFILVKLSCTATQRLQPLSTLCLSSTPLSSVSVSHRHTFHVPRTACTGMRFHSYFNWGFACVPLPATLKTRDCNVSYGW